MTVDNAPERIGATFRFGIGAVVSLLLVVSGIVGEPTAKTLPA
jgi:hypothetical protein